MDKGKSPPKKQPKSHNAPSVRSAVAQALEDSGRPRMAAWADGISVAKEALDTYRREGGKSGRLKK